MFDAKWAVLDTETTGFYPLRGDKIVEIAIISLKGHNLQDKKSFSTLINPGKSIPLSTTRVHGITDEMVQNAPKFSEIADDMMKFLEEVDYVFMHNAKFDLGFLEQEMKAIQKSFSFPKIICSVELSQALYPQEKSHNLNAISKRCGLSIKKGEERHRALGDVILTAEVLIRFSEENPLIFSGMLDQLCTSIEK